VAMVFMRISSVVAIGLDCSDPALSEVTAA
jgi:hypothetical protein